MTTLTKEQIEKSLITIECDGHTIFKKETFDFLPKEFLEKLVYKFESDRSDPKAMIFNENNEPLLFVYGVYGLSLLWAIAKNIKADTSEADQILGRGFQARALDAIISKKIKEME